MRALVTTAVSLVMALTALGLAVAAPGGDRGARLDLRTASGALSIANSREDQAVFAATAMRPGEGVSGTLRIGNGGDVPGRFSVRRATVQDVPGPGGGRLSQRVELVLFDVTDVQRPVTVYAGAPASFGAVDLGTFAAGAERDYLVAATLPAGGAATDNRYQGSTLSLGFEWRAGPVAAPTPTPTPTPKPKPKPKPTPTPAPIAPPAPPAAPPTTPRPAPAPAPTPPAEPTGAALADALGLPSARRCVSRRRFTVRLRVPGGARVVSATVTINGKVKARVKGARTRAPVNLRGLPRGKVKVKLTTRASNGRTYKSRRTYRTCRAKRR